MAKAALNLMITKEQSNKDYDSGRWKSLHAIREVGQYSVMAGLAVHCGAKVLLDVGCGEGNLLKYLPCGREHTTAYRGIDISSSAVERAKFVHGHLRDYASFEEADFWKWTSPPRKFDAVFFSGSLQYLGDRDTAVERVADWLAPNGTVIIALYREYPGLPKWKQIEQFTLANMDTFWTVSAFRK